MQGTTISNGTKTDLTCALFKILANLLKNNTVQYKHKRKVNLQCSNEKGNSFMM